MTPDDDTHAGRLAGQAWSTPATVSGFVRSPPNATLIQFAAAERERGGSRAVDVGCGAGRNLVPLAERGWTVIGTDLSWPMLAAARERIRERHSGHALVVSAPMETLPLRSHCVDLIVAHGIWNLARSTAQFRAAIREAARVARDGAALFVFTFSRETLPHAQPAEGERFVFTQFADEPQIFLTADELLTEMNAVGFVPEPAVPLTTLNRPQPGGIRTSGAPIILQGAFRYRASRE